MRSAEEILATLDERGELENLPFMPEMLAFCGQRLTVHKVAHKLCDTISRSGMRRMTNAVHLTGVAVRWFRPRWLPDRMLVVLEGAMAASSRSRVAAGSVRFARGALQRCSLFSRSTHARSPGRTAKCGIPARPPSYCVPLRHACPSATSASTSRTSAAATSACYPSCGRSELVCSTACRIWARRFLPRRLWFRDGLRWRFLKGGVVGRTPTGKLDLQPGELVRIKSKNDILATLDENLLNRGMGFDEEMLRFCGQTRRCSVQGRALHRREDRPDADYEESLHHFGEQRLQGGLHRELPARVRAVLAGDLARKSRGG